MQFIDDDSFQIAQQMRDCRITNQQGHLLWRGDQDVRRRRADALALGCRRIARAGFDGDGKRHLHHRLFQIAGDVDGQGFQRRNIQRVNAVVFVRLRQFLQRRQKPRQSFAAACGRNQQRTLPIKTML